MCRYIMTYRLPKNSWSGYVRSVISVFVFRYRARLASSKSNVKEHVGCYKARKAQKNHEIFLHCRVCQDINEDEGIWLPN